MPAEPPAAGAAPSLWPAGATPVAGDHRITLRAFVIGLLFAGGFAYLTVRWENVPPNQFVTSTQIPVLPYALLMVSVLALNPLLRWARLIRPLTMAELMAVFIMGAVSSGISTFGMASQLIPVVGGLQNRHWNNQQSRWDIYLEPFIREGAFINEPGTREAAIRLRTVELQHRQETAVLSAATRLLGARRDLVDAQQRLAALDAIAEPAARTLKQQPIRRELEILERGLRLAESAWGPYHQDYDPAAVVATFPARIARLAAELAAARTALDALHEKVFARIDVFRRGLPPAEQRAVPGILYTPGEGLDVYRARVSRLYYGVKALRELKQGAGLLAEDRANARAPGPGVLAACDRGVALLEPIATCPAIAQKRSDLDGEVKMLQAELTTVEKELKDLRDRRRFALATQFKRLDREIAQRERHKSRLDQRIARSSLERDQLLPHLQMSERVATVRQNLVALREKLAAASAAEAPGLAPELNRQLQAFSTFDASWRRFLVGEVPWETWLGPLSRWAVLIALTYLVLMTFNVLIFRQWAHNEKLIYPLAELPLMLAGSGAAAGPAAAPGSLPPVYRTGLFWAGFGVAAAIMGWNLLAKDGLIQRDRDIQLTYRWLAYLQGSIFEALGEKQKIHIFFTLIGLTFLVPAQISRSLWGFHLVYLVQVLILVWLGYGRTEESFEMDWNLVANFRTAEGGGALLVFAVFILWRCRHFLFCCANPAMLHGLPVAEQRELKVCSLLFLCGSVALILGLNFLLGVNVFYGCLCYFLVLVITIGLVRAVAEGGLLGFQCWFGPFHFVRTALGMNKWWTAPSFFAPLMVYYSVLFLDIKAFIAPAMANALKIRDDLQLSRLRFHLAILGGILVACVVGVATHLILAYQRGADSMQDWFYTMFPRDWMFGHIKTMLMTNPTDTQGGLYWLLFGGLAMGAVLYFRQRVFWVPHPIGLIMLVNPIMNAYWSSILIGWLCKVLVSKYGNRDTYNRLRCFFIGLIAGELAICVLGLDLNRNP